MKIAEIIGTFPPLHGGMGYICYNNAMQLAKRGHEITVFTLHYKNIKYDTDPQEFNIIRLKTPVKYGDAGMIPQLYTMLEPFDIIHLHYPFFGAAEYVYFASMIKNKKYFLTYHMDVHGDTGIKKAVIGLYEPLFLKKIVQQAHGICSPGNKYLESTKAGSFVPWQKVTSVGYGGVDITKFHPQPKNTALLKKYGIEGKKVALFVGNLIPFKGLHLLIDAISQIQDSSIVLLVVGGGYHEKEYKQQVKNLEIESRVVFAGPQSPDQNLPAHYNLGDFLVLPSTHSESFGLVILEAMASGKPVITSALPGPSQLIDHGVDGFISKIGSTKDLKKHIINITSDKNMLKRMGEMGREKVVQTYTWEKIGADMESTFKDIASKSQ